MPVGPGCGARGRRRGLAGRRAAAPSHTPGPAGVEGAGGAGGPDRGAGGRRQGLSTRRQQAPTDGRPPRADQHYRAWPRCRWAAAGPGRTPSRRTQPHTRPRRCGGRRQGRGRQHADDEPDRLEAAARPAGPGRRPPAHTAARPSKHNEAARPHRGPGGSRIRPLGGSQRLFQRICVPAAPRRWQASTTRAAMPASADLPHVRGSYCFLMPTSPSILRTPS